MSRIGDIRFHDSRVAGGPGVAAVRALSNHQALLAAGLLFLAPNALFAVTALRPAPAAAVLAGCAGVGAFLWQSRTVGKLLSEPLDPVKLGWCLAVGFALCLLGGEGHFFYANSDWLTRDAVLADLVRDGAMPLYQFNGRSYYLRAPLGMFMLPAALGWAFGLFAAHAALLFQNAALFGSILYLASSIVKIRAPVFLFLLVGFGGLDIVGDFAAWATSFKTGDFTTQSLEWWSDPFAPSVALQYSSMVTQLFWAPNHAAPGWFIAVLILLWSRAEIRLSTMVVSCAPLVIWSPLSVLGAIPLVAVVAVLTSWRQLFTSETLVAATAGSGFLPIAAYLVADGGSVAHGWQTISTGFATIYVAFLLIELPQAAILLHAWRRIEPADRLPLAVALATLCLLPLYGFGPANDLVMRASIPSLFLVAFNFARIAATTPRDGGAFASAISAIVILSAVTPALQFKQALVEKRFDVSDCNMATTWETTSPAGAPQNYVVRAERMPRWLISPEAAPAPARVEYRFCWPDHPERDWLSGERD